jgi:serine/threonine protein kinase
MVEVLGTRLGRYEIRERIGRGGMATVYKARDTNLDRWVAVKVLHDHLADDADFKDRFEREAKLVATLNHPNIVQVFDFDRLEQGPNVIYYMVMPFINGPSLRTVMEQRRAMGGTLSLEEVDQIMEAVCKGLSYAHKQGMIHRDVTPSNILFNEDGNIVLADFGLARMIDGARVTQTGMTTGTPLYMSPEQGMGEALDARTDIYAVGVILYEMLAGKVPFDGDSAYAIIMKHVNDTIPLSEINQARYSPAMAGVLQRALAKNREDRHGSADALLQDFKRAALGSMDTAIRGGIGTVILPLATRRAKRRLPLALGAAAVSLIAIVALVAFVRPAFVADKPAMVTLAVLPTIDRPIGNSMTDSSVPFADDFSAPQHSAWMLNSGDSRITRKFEDNVLRIRNTLPATAITTIVNPRSIEYSRPIVISAVMTISADSQGPSATGVIFRYESDDEYYVFAFDGLRRVSIWLRKNGNWTELRDLPTGEQWTPDPAVRPPGEPNTIVVIANGAQLTARVNGKQVISVTADPQIRSGGVGIYLATTTNPNETAPLAQVDIARYSVQPFSNNMIPTPINQG